MADLNARIKPKKSSTAGEVPQAADLEIAELAVNTADGKLFVKHTDNSIKEISGSGGGAVDSVNGQTGVVNLALDDISDVAAGPIASTQTWAGTWTMYTLTDDQVMAGNGRMGPASGDEINFYLRDNSGTDYSGELSALENNTLWWRKNSEPWQSETMTAYRDYSVTTLIPSAAGLSASVAAASLGDNYTLSDGRGAEDYSPVDGQVLAWSDASNEWQPVDPPQGGGNVDSVNGQTGVVSLGIRDMNDFDASGFEGLSYTFDSADSTPDPGEVYKTSSNGWPVFYFDKRYDVNGSTIGDGTSVATIWGRISDGDSMTVVFEGTEYVCNVFDIQDLSLDRIKLTLTGGGISASLFTNSSGEEVTFKSADFEVGNPTDGLQDNDAPIWQAASGAFRPLPVVQSIDGQSGVVTGFVSLADLKAVVADSTDFADFQSRVAAM